MARARRTIDHNPLDELVAGAIAVVELNDKPVLRRPPSRGTNRVIAQPRVTVRPGEATLEARVASLERQNWWLRGWVAAGLVVLIVLVVLG